MKTNAQGVEMLANKMYDEYKLCFCKDSTEKWIKIFAGKRFERIRDEEFELTGKTLSKAFEKKVITRFTELMLEYVKECKKIARQKEREQLEERKQQVKRGKVK